VPITVIVKGTTPRRVPPAVDPVRLRPLWVTMDIVPPKTDSFNSTVFEIQRDVNQQAYEFYILRTQGEEGLRRYKAGQRATSFMAGIASAYTSLDESIGISRVTPNSVDAWLRDVKARAEADWAESQGINVRVRPQWLADP